MTEPNKKLLRTIMIYVFIAAAGCILLYGLLHEAERVGALHKTISDITAPFVLGGVLAFILNVPMRAIENGILKKMTNYGIKRVLAVILTFIAMLLVVALVFWLLIPQIVTTVNSLIPNLSNFVASAQDEIVDFLRERPEIWEWFKQNTAIEDMSWKSIVQNLVQKVLDVLSGNISPILGSAVSVIGSLFNGIFNTVIGIVFCVYCLFQKETLARQGRKLLYAFCKERIADKVVRIMRLTNTTFSNFLSGQCIEVCILGVLFAISMAIFRMPYIPLISVVIAVTAFIPIVGAWVGCVIGAFLIFVENPLLAVGFVVMFLVLQLIENNMIYPRVVGTSVGLSGMWVLLAVAVGGELIGVAGMFLMIPAASVMYTLLREFTHKKLGAANIDAAKLQPQPPELNSKFKEKRANNKAKQQSRKASKNQQSKNK